MEELELVEVEDNEVSGAEDGHQDTHAAEEERVEGPAEGPPGAQEEEDEEVNRGGQRGQHDTCNDREWPTHSERFECETVNVLKARRGSPVKPSRMVTTT